jgi:hypothetical protein
MAVLGRAGSREPSRRSQKPEAGRWKAEDGRGEGRTVKELVGETGMSCKGGDHCGMSDCIPRFDDE